MSDDVDTSGFKSILVLCTHNSVRSPMCAAILRCKLKDRAYITSAGVNIEDSQVNRFAIEVMEESGCHISEHVPVAYTDLEDQSFDIILALSQPAYALAKEIAEKQIADVEFWDLPEPPGILAGLSQVQMLEACRKIREDIKKRVIKRFG